MRLSESEFRAMNGGIRRFLHRRLLKPGGVLVVEEPDAALLRGWDRIFRWAHPHADFSLAGLEQELRTGGVAIERCWKLPGVFGAYRARMATLCTGPLQ